MNLLKLARSFLFLLPVSAISVVAETPLLDVRFNGTSDIELLNGAQLGPASSGVSGQPGDLCYFANVTPAELQPGSPGPGATYNDVKAPGKLTGMTVTLWYKGLATGDTTGMLLQGCGWNLSLDGEAIGVWLYNTRDENARFGAKGKDPWQSPGWNFLAVTWANDDQHVTFFKGDATQSVSINAENGIRPFPDGIVLDQESKVGIGNNSINYFSAFGGSIDDVRIFPRVLTSDELDAIRKADLANEEPALK